MNKGRETTLPEVGRWICVTVGDIDLKYKILQYGMDNRVELTIKKFNFALHEKTLATIYRNKTEFDILFSF